MKEPAQEYIHLIEARFFLTKKDFERRHKLLDEVFLHVPVDLTINCLVENGRRFKVIFDFASQSKSPSEKSGQTKYHKQKI